MQPEKLTLTQQQLDDCSRLSGEPVEYFTYASTLGFKPGEWPTRITMPSGMVLSPTESDAASVIYGDVADISLTVWNDTEEQS